jgi:hypothetical protein
MGPDGAMWFGIHSGTTYAVAIGRMTTSGAFTEFDPPQGWYPYPGFGGITKGPYGRLWFTVGEAMGSITTSGEMTIYGVRYPEIPNFPLGQAGAIVEGSDGNLWLSAHEAVGTCTTHWVCTGYEWSAGDSWLTEGPDGAVWFTGPCCNVGRISTDGVITTYAVPGAADTVPLSPIVTGSDGALWLSIPGQIVRMNTEGVVLSEYPLANPNAQAASVAAVPGGIWFSETEFQGAEPNRVALMVPLTASLAAEPTAFRPGDMVTLSGGGFAPGETVNLLYSAEIGKALPATATADPTGSFVVTGQAGPAPWGDGSVTALGQSSGKLGVADVMINPRLILEPNTGSVGDTITATGEGFIPGGYTAGELVWRDFGVLGSTTVGQFGQLTSFTFAIPPGAQPGEQQVIEEDSSAVAAAYVNVVASAPSQ